jgi:hypothetical protein
MAAGGVAWSRCGVLAGVGLDASEVRDASGLAVAVAVEVAVGDSSEVGDVDSVPAVGGGDSVSAVLLGVAVVDPLDGVVEDTLGLGSGSAYALTGMVRAAMSPAEAATVSALIRPRNHRSGSSGGIHTPTPPSRSC